jgi:NAD(P)H-hydrate epimerase
MPAPAQQPLRLTRAQVREIDRRSIEDYHIPGVVLMENAARAVVDAVCQLDPAGEIAILCGGGNNGGDGLAVARHLHNRGRSVTVVFGTDPATLRGDALVQWQIVRAMQLPAFYHDPATDLTGVFILREAGFIVDALFGTGLTSAPKDSAIRFIDACNYGHACGRPTVAIDIPSGLDCDTGVPLGPACVRATRTVTFVAEKAGFANPIARQYLGEVTVGDIGCPRELIEAVAATGSAPPPT